MEFTERQRLNEAIRQDLHLDGAQQLIPTASGVRHFVMVLGPAAENEKLWRALPPLKGANKFREFSPGAQVLAVNQNEQPLLAVHQVGAGRVMAFAADSTWRWWMQGHQAEHRRFWRQCILWLAHKDQDNDAAVWVRPAERRYRASDRVELTAGAQTAEGDPITDATITGEVTLPDGTTRPIRLARRGEYQAGVFLETKLPGDYAVAVEATRTDGTLIGKSRARFLVETDDLELNNPQANPGLLARLASLTGGAKLVPEQLPPMLQELAKRGLNTEVQTFTKVEPWDELRWPLLLVFAGLLTTEWFCRKRWGLV
jgi:hypothetical protein